jgi:hypothetical protein
MTPASQPPSRGLRLAEYASLRSTIAARGTARLVLVPAVVVAWAATSAALIDNPALPIAAVFPLAILVAGFEATYSLHTGVERLGRYIQVFFEETEHAEWDGATWETTAMAGGPAMPRGGTDPIFTPLFCAAVVANLAATLVSDPPSPVAAALSLAHGAAVVRMLRARQLAGTQRRRDLDHFRGLRNG